MAIQMAVGIEDFEAIIKSGQYYVDKTELLYDLVEKTGNEVTLFTRPRRFGLSIRHAPPPIRYRINIVSIKFCKGIQVSGCLFCYVINKATKTQKCTSK